MRNEQPRKLILSTVKGGFNKVYITTNEPTDYDLLGMAFWVRPEGSTSTPSIYKVDALDTKVTLSGLLPNTSYEIYGTFYDSLVDDQLLAARSNIEVSDTTIFATKSGPVILDILLDSPDVDIGVTLPILQFLMDGVADSVIIEYLQEGSSTWEVLYTGFLDSTLYIPAPGLGNYQFRTKGIVYDDSGSISEVSVYNTYNTEVSIGFNFSNPTAPTSLSYKVAKVLDTFERYDLKLSWDWEKGSNAGLKGFVVSYISEDDYGVNGFTNASSLSVGATTSCILSNFPYNVPMRVRVAAVSYGTENNTAFSDSISLKVDSSTSIDNSFIEETNVEVLYSGIYGYRKQGVNRILTFNMSALTGTLGIGAPDSTTGIHPIHLDGTTGILSVDGGIVTKKINAADFVLTNFSGKDNPAMYTEGKTWNDGVAGIWMGYDNTDGKYKFDLGNASQSIKWDGNELNISGNVTVGTTLGNINLEEVVGKRTVWVYREGSSRPSSPTETSYPPLYWTTTPTAVSSPFNVLWACSGTISELTNSLVEGTTWSTPVQFSGSAGANGEDGEPGTNGNTSFKSIVFVRSVGDPGLPTGGSFGSPVPSGWFDGIPEGDSPVWSSTRIFSDDGQYPQQTAWTAQQKLTNTSTQEIMYSALESNPGTPTSDPTNWSSSSTGVDAIWLAIRLKVDGVFGDWEVNKIKGENGEDGLDGQDGQDGQNGISSFKSIVFKRNPTNPGAPTGGSYVSPVPTGWEDGVPSGELTLWSSSRVFSSDGGAPQTADWTYPQQMTSTSTQEFMYSSVSSSPGTPSSNAANWTSSADSGSIWMAMRQKVDGVLTEWSVVKIKGEDGASGYWVDYRFRRYPTKPDTPTGITPAAWPDSPAEGSDPLWMIKMQKQYNGQPVSGATWSDPVRMEGVDGASGESIEVNWSVDGATWHAEYVDGDLYMRQRTTNGSWSDAIRVVGEQGEQGDPGEQGAFKSTVFIRQTAQPTNITGGNYLNPVPSGNWSDGIPSGELTLWSSTRIFTPSGGAPQTANWTTAVKVADSSTQEFKYSSIANSPGNPTDNPGNWTSSASASTIWMATRFKLNGVYGSWDIIKVKGESGVQGLDGSRGAGLYVISNATGTWNDNTANSACPSGVPVEDDTVTIFKSGNPAIATTKRFNGSSWTTPELVVHGDMIATGTMAGDRLTAYTEITAPTINGGTMQLIGPNIMLIQSATPFGPDNLVEWKGPKLLSGSSPNFGLLSKSNAVMWSDSSGNTYFGGTLSAGILSTASVNTQKPEYTVNTSMVDIGPFTTNGGSKTLTISYTLVAGNAYSGSCPTNPSSSHLEFDLYRRLGIGSWQYLRSYSTTGSFRCNVANGQAEITETNTLSTTYTDNSTSSEDFSYKLVCTNYQRYLADTNVQVQEISIRSTEA